MKGKSEHQLDSLLATGLVTAPEKFSEQLIHRLSTENESKHQSQDNPQSKPVSTPLWQWLALGTAGFAGAIQITGFVFGIWAATTAG